MWNIWPLCFKHNNPHGFSVQFVNSLRPRQNGRLFADDTFKRIFLNENIRISTKNSLKFVPKGLINNIPALVLIMAWHLPGDNPLSEPMMVRLPKHICVARPQWVKHDSVVSHISQLKTFSTQAKILHCITIKVYIKKKYFWSCPLSSILLLMNTAHFDA